GPTRMAAAVVGLSAGARRSCGKCPLAASTHSDVTNSSAVSNASGAMDWVGSMFRPGSGILSIEKPQLVIYETYISIQENTRGANQQRGAQSHRATAGARPHGARQRAGAAGKPHRASLPGDRGADRHAA